MDDAHAHHLHGKHRGGEWGAKQGGKQAAHAAHDLHIHLAFPQVHPLAHLAGQTAANLQGCPLPARAAAGEVGEHRADENEGGQAQGRTLAGAHAGDDLVGAAVIFHATDLVQPHNGQARQGHTQQQPGVLPPPCGHQSDGMRKGGPRRPAYHTRESRQHGPVDPGPCRGADPAPEIPRFFSHILPPFTVTLVISIIFPPSLHCQGRGEQTAPPARGMWVQPPRVKVTSPRLTLLKSIFNLSPSKV